MKLNNKNIIVIGGDNDLGIEIAKELEKQGAIVTSTYYEEPKGKESIRLDVTDPSVVTDLFNNIQKLDGVIYCPGFLVVNKFRDISFEEWQRSLEINLTGAFLCFKQALPLIKKSKGFLLAIASISSYKAGIYQAAYCASKFGLLGMVESLKLEYPELLINTISPGPMATKMIENYMTKIAVVRGVPKSVVKKELKEKIERFLDPEEVAKIIIEILLKGKKEAVIIDNYVK